MMTTKQRADLISKILKDLKILGLSPNRLEYNLDLRPYSKKYYGRYIRRKDNVPKVVVYLYKDSKKTEVYSYQDLFSTIVHEVCHHIQYSDPDYVRVKGVMHDKQFWDMWNNYMNKYFEYSKSRKEGRYLLGVKRSIRKGSHNSD